VDGALVRRSLLETVARARLRPTTWTNYLYAVRVHIGPSLGSVRLRSLTPALVRRFLAERTEAGLAANSVRIIHATLRTMLAEAVRDELGERNVASIVRGPRIDHEKVARGHSTKLRRSWPPPVNIGCRHCSRWG
jgi:integrase